MYSKKNNSNQANIKKLPPSLPPARLPPNEIMFDRDKTWKYYSNLQYIDVIAALKKIGVHPLHSDMIVEIDPWGYKKRHST